MTKREEVVSVTALLIAEVRRGVEMIDKEIARSEQHIAILRTFKDGREKLLATLEKSEGLQGESDLAALQTHHASLAAELGERLLDLSAGEEGNGPQDDGGQS